MNQNPSLLLTAEDRFFGHLLRWRGLGYERVGRLYKIPGYQDHNNLVRINSLFSGEPSGEPVDRTQASHLPLRYFIHRPWQPYQHAAITLAQALGNRCQDLMARGQKINIMWSGGTDSTTIVNAFLQHATNRDQIRVLYSPWSRYEHPQYLDWLADRAVETVDISGTVYLDTYFDGIFVTGDMGDESNASLDESFIDRHGMAFLRTSWRDWFWSETEDQQFMDWCEVYFSRAGRSIHTVLEARWWFYINSKYYCQLNRKMLFWVDYPGFSSDLVHGFYDCVWFESYIRDRVDEIVDHERYGSWKKYLRDYCVTVDGFTDYHRDKTKFLSRQLMIYAYKKAALKNLHALMILADGQRVHTPNLPMCSQMEFHAKYGQSLDYIWNRPDHE